MDENLIRMNRRTVLVGSLAAAVSAPGFAATKRKAMTVRFAGTLPLGHHISKAQELFRTEVEKKTNGEVRVQIFPAGQLYKDTDLVNAIPSGGVHLAVANLGQWAGLIPEVAICDLAGIYQTPEQLASVQDDGDVRAILDGRFRSKRVQFVNPVAYGMGSIISREPYHDLAALKGARIRASTEYNTIWLNALGATSTVISSAEIYQALQTGTLDGALTGPSSFVARKLFEVAKYQMANGVVYGNFAAVANAHWWDGLPDDVRTILVEAGDKMRDWSRVEAAAADTAALKQLEGTAGNTVYQVAKGEYDGWLKMGLAPQMEAFKKRVGGSDADKLLIRMREVLGI